MTTGPDIMGGDFGLIITDPKKDITEDFITDHLELLSEIMTKAEKGKEILVKEQNKREVEQNHSKEVLQKRV